VPDPDTSTDPTGWTCPVPLRHQHRIVLGHGGGGQLSSDLVHHLLAPAFGTLGELHDAAVLDGTGGSRLAFTTDSYVVQPLFFPGGSIGDLAVHGTVNDLAMSGARPIGLSCALIVEEGTEIALLGRVVDALADAARTAGVPIVTGDTKVVESGSGDAIYVNTAGVGVVPDGVRIGPSRVQVGDVVILSGPIGEHGIAVLSRREGLDFATDVRSDTRPLHHLVAAMIATGADLHMLRDPTRGGLAATLCEIAGSTRLGIEYEESSIPVPDGVAAACSFLGLDPMHVANEGKLVAFVPAADADRVLEAMRADPAGSDAVTIGRVVAEHPGVVAVRTRLGTRRVVDLPLGEQLPRIC
jgi:hydrogenase expression/formation protein HypE